MQVNGDSVVLLHALIDEACMEHHHRISILGVIVLHNGLHNICTYVPNKFTSLQALVAALVETGLGSKFWSGVMLAA